MSEPLAFRPDGPGVGASGAADAARAVPPEVLSRFGLGADSTPALLAGDVGARRYFRITRGRGASVLLVLYPEPHSAAQAAWAAIGRALSGEGLRVPELHADAPELGAALVEDLGSRDLALEIAEAGPADRARLLDEAEELLVPLQRLPRVEAGRNPPFDAAFFRRELAHTRHWAFERGGTVPMPEAAASLWEALAGQLAAEASDPAGTGDPVPTHRDFHANNLMRAPDGRLALIDFQDLRLGPPDYDPVSLRFERIGESVPCEADGYSEAVLLQRAWKVLGTFEKMLGWGREVYRPHRDATIRVLCRHTRPGGTYAPLLGLLELLPR